MRYKAILFDMDGTLLPMNVDDFTKGYFKMLCKKMCPIADIDPELNVKGIWAGVKLMVLNDGSRKNVEAFWEGYEKVTGVKREVVEDICERFYGEEFLEAKVFTDENPFAVKAVELAHQKADKVVLATNPLFPLVAQKSRMSFVGLKEEDFDLVTAYEEERYAKPNPKYYVSILDRIGYKAEECLMIGNDVDEDMLPAMSVGLDTYLITDNMITGKEEYTGKQGSFKDLVEYLESL
ncbi:MAG: HAD family hydrolase [Erysipelotrichaceae bacterium]|nr:HAD family hydrolase [Erysipelotrichaceae bacterium]